MVTTQELQAIEEENARIASQKIPQRRYGSGVTKQVQQQYIQRQQQARANVAKIQAAQTTSSPKLPSDYQSAVGLANRYVRGDIIKASEYLRLSTESRRLYNQMIKGYGGTSSSGGTVQVEGIGGFSVAPELQESFAERYAGRGYTVTTDKYVYPGAKTAVTYSDKDIVSINGQEFSVAPEKQGMFVINKKVLTAKQEKAIIDRQIKEQAEQDIKFIGSPGENAVFIKGSVGSQILTPVKTVSKFIDFITPKKLIYKELSAQQYLKGKYPLRYKASEFLITNTAESINLGTGFRLASPSGKFSILSTSQSTMKLIEPTIRVKDLAKPQSPKTMGFDVKPINSNAFIFEEKIKVPRRYQYVNTPTMEYFNFEPIKTTYAKPREFIQTGKVLYSDAGELAGYSIIKEAKKFNKSSGYIISGTAEKVPFESLPINKQLKALSGKRVLERKSGKAAMALESEEYFRSNIVALRTFDLKGRSGKTFKEFTLSQVKPGRRLTRANIIGYQKKIGEGDLGETFAYKFNIKDVTYRKLVTRKKIVELDDIIYPKEISPRYPEGLLDVSLKGKKHIYKMKYYEDYEPRRFPTTKGFSFIQRESLPKFNDFFRGLETKQIPKVSQTILAKQASSTVFKLVKQPKPIKLNKNIPIVQTKQIVRTSAYFGTGTYEVSPAYTYSTVFSPQRTTTSSVVTQRMNLVQMNPSRSLQRSNLEQQSKLSMRQSSSLINLESLRTNLNQTQLPKQGQRQAQRLSQALRSQSIRATKQDTKLRVRGVTPRSSKGRLFPFGLKLPKFKGSLTKDLTKGFRTFYIQKGKKKYLPGLAPKGKALMRGQEFALKNLRATFGVEQGKKLVKGNGLDFKVRQDLFRGYRIRQGKRINLQDTYIQRRGKRLATRGEIRELIGSRRR